MPAARHRRHALGRGGRRHEPSAVALDRWAHSEGRACSLYLHNLLATPANLPRVLVRNVVGKLTWTERGSFSGTVLFQLLSTAIGRALGDVNGFRSWSLLRQTLLDVLVGAAPGGPADAGLADPTVVDVLFRFYRSVLRRRQGKEDGTTAALAVQWLHGDAIPADPAHELLGLPPANDPDAPVQIEDAQQIKQVLVALSRFTAACQQPFILAFDQVDNLEEQQAAPGRFLEAVIDSARNMLVVTAGIQSISRLADNRVIQDSACDRVAQIQLARQRPAQRHSPYLCSCWSDGRTPAHRSHMAGHDPWRSPAARAPFPTSRSLCRYERWDRGRRRFP